MEKFLITAVIAGIGIGKLHELGHTIVSDKIQMKCGKDNILQNLLTSQIQTQHAA